MKLKTLRRLCMVMCAVVFSSALFAESSADTNQLVAQQSTRSRSNKSSGGNKRSMWKPYFMKLRDTEPTLTSFYQQNVGIGFLYFGGIKGNLQPSNQPAFPKLSRKVLGHLMYNRTPLVELVVGTDIFRWWKIGIAYQHQGGIVVQTRPQVPIILNPNSAFATSDFTSQVRLDAVQFKTYFMFPKVLVWFNVYNEPYLGLAVGPGWQTWIDNEVGTLTNTLRPKFSANCTFTIDLGWKFRKAMPSYVMSFVTGCKFNYWGQARSMGKASQQYQASGIITNNVLLSVQDGTVVALSNPLRIENVYQFAPYIGVQFAF